ncbi:FkbM family methyltransferase [Actibacterium sp. 188UL27-1]|uniref:FkbM family methyltransferase n=1 Tax=Actibacterium sp. 188UL27-1 TaxID=2786961 RepID=UPI001957DFDE|nr:FkbM family methyltransferase [Actibacterium sp. 188UL27-1]MBM7068754.1 FkbM family methyltransferase [Actibacterium sp. 188UL27-1]
MSQGASPLQRLKYRVLSHLPGQRGVHYLHKATRARWPEVQAEFAKALEAAKSGICIDLGANLGVMTCKMAAVAETVYAFEPDPWTVAQLRDAVRDLPNVEVIEAAAGTEAGMLPLYRSAKFDHDPEKGSLSATLIAEKTNVTETPAAEVQQVDFPAFIRDLDRDVAIIKIDIEGGEVALLEALLEDPVLTRIGHIFVETHETRVPALAARSITLRRRVRGMTRPRICMDWD